MNERRRMPAEWEPVGAVMVAMPHAGTDWAYMLDEVEACYDELVRAIARHAVAIVVAPDTAPLRELFADIPADRLLLCDVPTNDTWTRDYGPVTVREGEGTIV